MSLRHDGRVSFILNDIRRGSKMSRFVFSAFFSVAVLTIVIAEELYSAKYDYVDVTEILTNERLRKQYYNCFMDTAPCVTPDAKFFKGNLPESMVTKCRRCTERQKDMFDEMSVWYTENRPDEWKALVGKFIEDAKRLNKDA